MTDVAVPTEIQHLDIRSLHRDPHNRKPGDCKELAESIREQGILQPIIVRPNKSGFMILMGERRWTAAKLAKLAHVPCIVRDDLTDAGAAAAQIVENIQRKDIEPLEEARGYSRLLELKVAQSEIATRVGRSEAHVSKRLALLELPDVAQKELSAGNLTLDDAYELRVLKDMPKLTAEAIKLGKQWRNMPSAIAQVKRVREEERARQAIEKQLRDEGVEIVPAPSHATKSKGLGKGYDELPFTKAQHAKEPCHAGAVDDHGRYVGNRYVRGPLAIYVCTDPSRHTAKGASELKLPKGSMSRDRQISPAEKKQNAERAALNEAAKARRELLRELLKGRALGKPKMFEIVAQAIVARRGLHDWAKLACDLLDLDGKEDGYGTTLELYAAEGPSELLRAALAMAFAANEDAISGHYHRWTETDRDYLETLEFHGHEITKVEEKKLREVKA